MIDKLTLSEIADALDTLAGIMVGDGTDKGSALKDVVTLEGGTRMAMRSKRIYRLVLVLVDL